MLLISRVSSFLDQKKIETSIKNEKRSGMSLTWSAQTAEERKERKNQINWNWVYRDVHSMPRFLRALSLSSSCKSHTIASLALFKNFRLFLSLKKLWNSPIARAHSRGRIMFPALRQERKPFFFDNRWLFPLRSTLGCALTRLVAMSLSQSRGDFKVPVYFQLDKK